MASFEDHVAQANCNLVFLKEINNKSKFFDWQVTACFYIAVHLVNAHLAQKANLHYKSHTETKSAINPDNNMSIAPFSEIAFDSYISLEKLSRRSRYLCNDKQGQDDNTKSFLTYEKHVGKAIKRLDVVMDYFSKTHSVTFEKVAITCPNLKAELAELNFFT